MKKELYDALCVIKDECTERLSCRGCPLETGDLQCLVKEAIPEDWNPDHFGAVELPSGVKMVLEEYDTEESRLEYKVKTDGVQTDPVEKGALKNVERYVAKQLCESGWETLAAGWHLEYCANVLRAKLDFGKVAKIIKEDGSVTEDVPLAAICRDEEELKKTKALLVRNCQDMLAEQGLIPWVRGELVRIIHEKSEEQPETKEEPKPSFTPTEKRKRVLDDAIDVVCRDRCEMYGEVEDNFGVIADLWNAYLNAGMPEGNCKVDLGARQVAEMMILFKVGRAATAMEDHRDTYVDIAGYAACAGGMCDDTSR